jgi:phosphoribosyl 1,2-cyclic phosphodiesterase
MRVTILGSGASEGIPAFLCECSVCTHARRVRGKEIRRNSFALVTSASNETLLIDVPAHFKTCWDQGRFQEEALVAVLVTHRHDDHSLGLHYLWDTIPHNPARRERPLPVCMPSDVYELRVRPCRGLSAPADRGQPLLQLAFHL